MEVLRGPRHLGAGASLVSSAWRTGHPQRVVYKIKTDGKGAITEHKARITPKGFMQRAGVDYSEVFAPTGMYKTLRLGLSLAARLDLEVDQMDVPSAFLHADLEEDVYMEIPDAYREGREQSRLQAEEGPVRPEAGAAELAPGHQGLLDTARWATPRLSAIRACSSSAAEAAGSCCSTCSSTTSSRCTLAPTLPSGRS